MGTEAEPAVGVDAGAGLEGTGMGAEVGTEAPPALPDGFDDVVVQAAITSSSTAAHKRVTGATNFIRPAPAPNP
jgi:hypothetical protein